jgi:hypothetical protein
LSFLLRSVQTLWLLFSVNGRVRRRIYFGVAVLVFVANTVLRPQMLFRGGVAEPFRPPLTPQARAGSMRSGSPPRGRVVKLG